MKVDLKKLKRRRQRRGLTQSQVAKRMGITRSGYANLENGFRSITRQRAEKIDRVLAR